MSPLYPKMHLTWSNLSSLSILEHLMKMEDGSSQAHKKTKSNKYLSRWFSPKHHVLSWTTKDKMRNSNTSLTYWRVQKLWLKRGLAELEVKIGSKIVFCKGKNSLKVVSSSNFTAALRKNLKNVHLNQRSTLLSSILKSKIFQVSTIVVRNWC